MDIIFYKWLTSRIFKRNVLKKQPQRDMSLNAWLLSKMKQYKKTLEAKKQNKNDTVLKKEQWR